MTLAREPKQCFFDIWKEASWRTHLEEGIWEASGKLSEALWELSGELSGSWGAHGGLKGHLGQKMLQIYYVFQTKIKNKKTKTSISLRFLGVGVTIVCILRQLSAGAEPQRPLMHLGQTMLQIQCVLQQINSGNRSLVSTMKGYTYLESVLPDYSNVADVKISRGINASSIADISQIPRATVIRKLKWLTKQNCIKKNKNLEFQMTKGGKLNKKISENFLLNQHSVSEFLTDMFDLMKNSQFKL